MPRPLLVARWSDVLLAAWEAPEDLLRRWVPPGLELDRWQGRAYVDLVALRFDRVRAAGLPLPLVPGFAQLNLRTFVRRGDTAGVVFVALRVANRLVAALSRLGYGQPARALPISWRRSADAAGTTVDYRVGGPAPGRFSATGTRDSSVPSPASLEHFCKERYWGYGPVRRGRVRRFRVAHESWPVRPVWRWTLELDFAALFGADWQFLRDAAPALVTLAQGSAVRVYPPQSVD